MGSTSAIKPRVRVLLGLVFQISAKSSSSDLFTWEEMKLILVSVFLNLIFVLRIIQLFYHSRFSKKKNKNLTLVQCVPRMLEDDAPHKKMVKFCEN